MTPVAPSSAAPGYVIEMGQKLLDSLHGKYEIQYKVFDKLFLLELLSIIDKKIREHKTFDNELFVLWHDQNKVRQALISECSDQF